jgi:NAD(P)-dependent dehydrogenase (short-subunit alcohol dehydrogenase family)
VHTSNSNVSSSRRVLVVGASSGVGRATAIALARSGNRVVAMARRDDRLADVCAAGHGAIKAVSGDVRREASCRHAVDAAVATLGGLDAVVYCAGVSNMALVRDTSYEEWQRILETNVVGAGRVFAHACTELSTNRGQMVVLSSISEQRPKPGLVPYGASKAALRKLIEGLRSENPEVAFAIVTIGPTAGTEFGIDFDPRVAEQLMAQWRAGGFLAPGQMAVDDVADRIVECLASPMRTEDLVLLPRPNEP